jgi:hypothetical protein
VRAKEELIDRVYANEAVLLPFNEFDEAMEPPAFVSDELVCELTRACGYSLGGELPWGG